jgi:predicted nucleic acid-binding protein
VVSTQVLAEFFVVITRKVGKPPPPADARAVVQDYLHHRTVAVVGSTVLDRAMQRSVRSDHSLWDSMIIESALDAGCRELLSEDFVHGRQEEAMTIADPFV